MPQQNSSRSWGTRFDSFTSSDSIASNLDGCLPPPERAMSPNHTTLPTDESKGTHDRVVHDASIFIGSLPSNIDHAELANMLSQHLSQHPEVQTIKVVRDSKGGTCAFIQCQDADTATTLIQNLLSSPSRQFLGRYLRFEPARAFRTLMVSYRSPRQYVRSPAATNDEDGRIVELDLPTAMKFVKTGNRSEQLAVLYNSDATMEVPACVNDDSGLLLMPLLYDAETLRKIASVFGAVEYFGPYQSHGGDTHGTGHPPPHDGPRSPVMDRGCWEVKWCHRDDCVSALMTLRRVPHLTVTWAHQSSSLLRDQRPYQNTYRPLAGPISQSWQVRGITHINFDAHECSRLSAPNGPFGEARASSRSRTQHHGDVGTVSPAPSQAPGTWDQKATTMIDTKTNFASRPRAASLTYDRTQPHVPLGSLGSTGKLCSSDWELGTRADSESSYLRDNGGQELDVPPTPEFGASPITPRTPGSLMLRTPTTGSYMGDFQSFKVSDGHFSRSSNEKADDNLNALVDPTTVFVGGLEMFGPNAWDENKVRALFSKYGGVESVKVIRPNNKRSAFAFVKFNNTESPARAVSEQHNRVMDGRPIRVQLRDWNPSYRMSWRQGRARRPDHHISESSLVSRDELQADSNQGPGIIDVTERVGDLTVAGTTTENPSSAEVGGLDDMASEGRKMTEKEHLSCADDQTTDPVEEIRDVQKETKQVDGAPKGPMTVPPSDNHPPPIAPWAYHVPPVAYYPAQGWMPGFGPQFPYQTPFVRQPFLGYPFPQHLVSPFTQGNGSSDRSGTPTSTPTPFGLPGGTYTSFAPYPSSMGHPCPDSGPAPPGITNLANLPTQAPLMPTGFIHGDQGMLVPVYPPDALNQYMLGSQEQETSAPANTSGTADAQSAVAWRPYSSGATVHTQAVILHSYPNSHALQTPHQMVTQGWIPNHAWQGMASHSAHMQGVPGRQFPLPSPVGGVPTGRIESPFGRNLPSRRQHRRDNQMQYHKNNVPRSSGRTSRTTLSSSRSTPNAQPLPTSGLPPSDTGSDWQHWDVT
ncbi:hypothetical protein F5I97DRAFT_1809036 [Phlebopus sp. FC_14]|nr:hypothetical protein F5I97DRAFT_1809036 [Phlebopus sp. FC_14]